MYIIAYVRAVWKHWWALMSSAIFTFVGAYVLWSNKTAAWTLWVTFGFAVWFLLVASLLAWKTNYLELTELRERLKSPDLKVEINSSWWGPENNNVKLAAVLTISNPFGPPTAIKGWRIRVRAGLKEEIGEFPLGSPTDIVVPVAGRDQTTITLKLSDNLMSKTLSAPIPAGGAVGGWLIVVFRNVKLADFTTAGTVIEVEATDVMTGRVHCGKAVLDGRKGVKIPGV